jgi:hypothetical protein
MRRAIPFALVLTTLFSPGCVLPARAQHAPEKAVDSSLPDPRSLSAADWLADLHFLAEAIETRHPRPFHTVSRERFGAAVADLEARLPQLDYPQILVELSRLVAMLGPGDGHSRVRLQPPFFSGQLPLRFWHFADGLWVRTAAPEHAELVGRRVVGLGGLRVAEALDRVRAISASDNDFDRRLKVQGYLLVPEILQGLGLATEEGLEIELAAGADGAASLLRTVPFVGLSEGVQSLSGLAHDPARLGAPEGWVDMRPPGSAPPLYLSRPGDWYWMESLSQGKVIYAQFNVVGNQEGKPKLEDFFAELFEKAEPETVEKLVLDVRLNGGGNNFYNRPFIHGLIRSDTKNVRGRTYVLIGRNTFSAAQNLVTKLSHETRAVFVGEPTGGSPNHYGDARRVKLPASGLEVSISTLYWQDGGPFDDRPWVAPDIAVDLTAADYAAGRDPVLEAVVALDPSGVGASLETTLNEAFEEGGFEAAFTAYRAYRQDPAHRYVETERPMNRVGYWLLGNDMVDEAIRVFEANVADYPESWNVHDSLGEALMKAGKSEAAIRSYERSLELNPENAGAERALGRLRSGPHAGE